MNLYYKKIVWLFLLLHIVMLPLQAFALPFSIIPKAGTTLPSAVIQGTAVDAFYTVTNNTISQRNNNFVKFLPPNVIQVTNNGTYPDTCGATFNLGPRNSFTASCTLHLRVSGAVNANDPMASHHLFVCFPGGKTCAGTLYDLSVGVQSAPAGPQLTAVAVTPITSTILPSGTQQYVAVASYSDGSHIDVSAASKWASSNTSIATISASGLATGSSSVYGSVQISASYLGILSNTANLVVKHITAISISPTTASILINSTQQYSAQATYSDSSTADVTSSVSWNSSSPSVATVNSLGLATAMATTGTTQITAAAQGVTSNVSSLTIKRITAITLSPTSVTLRVGPSQQFTATATLSDSSTMNVTNQAVWASSTTAATVTQTGLVKGGNGMGTNTTNITAALGGITSANAAVTVQAWAYYPIPTNGFYNMVNCKVNASNATTSNCNSVTFAGSTVQGIAINKTGDTIYSTSSGNTFLVANSITAAAPVGTSPVQTAVGQVNSAWGIVIDSANSYVYVANNAGNSVTSCSVSGMTLNCNGTPVAMTAPQQITLNPAGNLLYIAASNGIYFCAVANGVISQCQNANGSGYSNPTSVVITPNNQSAFISVGRNTGTAGKLYYCNICTGVTGSCPNGAGSFYNCAQTATSITFSGGLLALGIDPTGNYLYTFDNQSLSKVCAINAGTTVSSCTGLSTGQNAPSAIVIH